MTAPEGGRRRENKGGKAASMSRLRGAVPGSPRLRCAKEDLTLDFALGYSRIRYACSFSLLIDFFPRVPNETCFTRITPADTARQERGVVPRRYPTGVEKSEGDVSVPRVSDR